MKNQIPTPDDNPCQYFAGLKRHKIFALILMVAGLASSVWAGAGTWTGSTSTDWNTAGNWSGGVPSGGNATIDLATGNICTLTANASATPVDIRIGDASGLTGRVDHQAGTLATGTGNWFFTGINTGTGYYNLANTASAGSGLTGFAQGSGSLSASIIWVGGAWYNDNGIGTMKINTTGTVNAYNTGWVSLCAGESWNGLTGIGEIDLESGTVNAAGELWLGVNNLADSGTASGTLKMTGGTLNVNTGNDGNPNYVGYNNGNGTMIVSNGTANFAGELRVGGSDTSGTGFNANGTLTMYGGNVNVGALTMARGNNNQNNCSGTVTVNGGTLTSTNDVVGGFAGAGTGTININGGTFNVGTTSTKWLQFGVWDTTAAVINVTNGNLNLNAGTSIKFNIQNSSGAHTINQYGGNVTFYSDFATTVGGGGAVDLRYASGSTGANTYNLNGGTLTVPQIIASQTTGTRAFNLNGGTLKAAAASSSFFASGVASAATVNSTSTIDNNGNAITIGQVLAGAGGLTFTDLGAAAVTTLTGGNTYTGNTTISAGTLALSGSGVLASTNLTVASGATFDVSAISFTLAGNGNLFGSGTVNGAVNTTSGSQIFPGTDGTAATLTFNNNLTMVTGATFNFDVSSSSVSGNDKVIVGGTLALNSTVFNLKGPATLATSDYTLAAATSVTGTPTINWVGTTPSNAGSFSVVNTGTTILLHFAAAPTMTASASPASVVNNQPVTLTALVTPGSGSIVSVTADLTPIGGVSNAGLVYSNTVSGVQVWTNTFAVSAGTTTGAKILNLTVTDNSTPTPYTGTAATGLTVNFSAETWDGGDADNNFTSNLNWSSGYAPGYTGDSLTFAGTTRTTPNMNASYSVSGITFDPTAGTFTVGTANSSTLTLTANGVVNNSANPQTLNVPLVLSAAQTFNSAADNLTLGQSIASGGNLITVTGTANTAIGGAVSGSGSLFKQGGGSLTISANGAWSGAGASSGGFSGPLIAQAGTTTFNNGSSNSVNGELVIGGVVANGGTGNNATMVVDGSILNGNSWLSVGRGNGIGTVTSALMLTNSAKVTAVNISCGYNGGSSANLPLTSVTLYNNSALALNGGMNIAESPGSVTTVTLNNSSTFVNPSTSGKSIGDLGQGTLYLNDNSSMSLGNAVTYVGYNSGTGAVYVASSATFTNLGELQVGGSDTTSSANNSYGSFTLNGGTAYVGSLTVARGNGAVNGNSGTVTVNGGTFISANDVILEFAGAGLGQLVLNGGNFIIGPTATKWFQVGWYDSGAGELDITSGNLDLENNSSIKFSRGGNSGANVINQGGGNVTFFSDAGTTVGGTGALDMNYSGGASQTYNLNGGTLTVPEIIATSSGGSSTFNFNGGTLKPTASTATFLQGLSAAYVQSGGAIIDTSGKNITIAQTLYDNGGGGLTKLGAGTLTLSGGYSYSGPTVVQAGTLALDASQSSGSGALTVSNATLSLSLNNGNAYLNAGNVSFTGITVLNLNFGTEAVPSSYPAIYANGYAVNNTGTNTINVAGPYLTVGEYQVIYTGGAVPTNNFKLGALPAGVAAVLINSGVSLDLLVTASGQTLTWFGADNSGNPLTTWDIGTSTNWNSANGLVKYLQYLGNNYGDNVTFDDSVYSPSDTSISLNATVVPLSVTFNNSSYGYSITGSGGIGGTTPVAMSGSGFTYLGTSNSYSGGTVIYAGTLAVTNDDALGASGGAVTLSGGTLQFSNSTVSTRSLTVVSNSTITVTAAANAQLSGTVSSGVSLTENGPGTLTLAGTSTTVALTVGGASGNSLMNLSGTLNASNLFVGNVSGANAAVTQTGGTANINGGTGDNLSIGNWDGSFGYFNAAGGTMNVNGISIGGEENPNVWPPVGGGDGLMEVNGETINNIGWITLARGGGPNNAILNVYSGSLTFSGGGLACNWNGNAATVTGSQTSIINILGGSVTSTNQGVDFRTSGQTGILNLNGGLLSCAGVSGSGSVNFNGGTLQAGPNIGSPFLNVAGNVFVFGGGAKLDDGGQIVTFSQPFQTPTDSGVSTIVLSDGGSGYIAPPIVTISGGSGSNATAVATISGGAITGITVTCPGTGYSPSDTLTVTYNDGGSSAVAPASTTVNLAPNISGGLIKQGLGTVNLDAINTYAGPTVVNAGTLAGNGTIAGALTNNATLAAGDAGSGALTVNGNLTLKTGSTNVFFVNGSTPANSSVAAGASVAYGGVVKIVPSGSFTAGQQFQLFSGTGATNTGNFASLAGSPGAGLAFSFTNGVLSVVATGPSGPASITSSVSGSSLSLTWPAGQSWRLVSQTNSLSTGLNNAAWGTVPGVSDGSASITIDPTKPAVFYRLVYP